MYIGNPFIEIRQYGDNVMCIVEIVEANLKFFCLYSGISSVGKMASLYWNGADGHQLKSGFALKQK